MFIPAAIGNMYPLHMLCDPTSLLLPCPLGVLMPSLSTRHHGITQAHAEELPLQHHKKR